MRDKCDYNAFRKGLKLTFTHGVYAAPTAPNTPVRGGVYAAVSVASGRSCAGSHFPSFGKKQRVYAGW